MAATIDELFEDRTETLSGKSTAQIAYVVSGALDEAEVKSTALANIPLLALGLIRRSIAIDERLNVDTWKVVARYELPEPGETGSAEPPSFSFDTGGGTQHVTQSISTVNKYGPKASDLLGGAIGYDGEHVQGVDITVPVYNFTETHFLSDAIVTPAFKATLFYTTGKVNDALFKGLQPGECLFLGASGSKRGEDDWEITFRFAASPNRTGITVGTIIGIDKKGWEYLWVQYADDVDNLKKQIVKKPIAVYIEKVYDEADFSALGIGVA